MSTLQSEVEAPPSIATADKGRWVVRLLWLGLACSVVGMAIFTPFGCDSRDYLKAIGQYAASINRQETFSLPYSPLFIIPTAGLVRLLPLWLTIALYGVAYFSGMLTEVWVGMQFATPSERKILRYVAPVIAFFPGLLIADAIAAGNMAYILYGLVLAAAAWGWRRERWMWFYLAVLAAACVKVHLLTLLAIPLLCGRRQWMRTVATGTIGLSLYALQSRIWPQAFNVYANTLKHMSQSKRDFGCGPAGNLARIMQHLGMPFEVPCILFYVGYASVLFLLLLWLSRLYREKRICSESWTPVMLLGVVLLNPRIQSYDVAAVSLPMALVAWRALRGDGKSARKPILIGAAIGWLALNILVEFNEDWVTVVPEAWKYVEMVLMLGVFTFGVRGLLKEAGVEWAGRSAFHIGDSFVPEFEMPIFESGSVHASSHVSRGLDLFRASHLRNRSGWNSDPVRRQQFATRSSQQPRLAEQLAAPDAVKVRSLKRAVPALKFSSESEGISALKSRVSPVTETGNSSGAFRISPVLHGIGIEGVE